MEDDTDYVNVPIRVDLTNAPELSDESEHDDDDDEDDDDDDDEAGMSPKLPDRRYTQNWSDFSDILPNRDADQDPNISATRGADNDLSKKSLVDNFILKERLPPDVRPKKFPDISDDNRSLTSNIDNSVGRSHATDGIERPIAAKRMNILRATTPEPDVESEPDTDNTYVNIDHDTRRNVSFKVKRRYYPHPSMWVLMACSNCACREYDANMTRI